jgi:hypothetical protein
MNPNRTPTILARAALGVGAAAMLATGADHLDEYTANHFSNPAIRGACREAAWRTVDR